jgi:hypothetical protein
MERCRFSILFLHAWDLGENARWGAANSLPSRDLWQSRLLQLATVTSVSPFVSVASQARRPSRISSRGNSEHPNLTALPQFSAEIPKGFATTPQLRIPHDAN